jgi:hypothetical protein
MYTSRFNDFQHIYDVYITFMDWASMDVSQLLDGIPIWLHAPSSSSSPDLTSRFNEHESHGAMALSNLDSIDSRGRRISELMRPPVRDVDKSVLGHEKSSLSAAEPKAVSPSCCERKAHP